ncbi:LysM peptidoglycan-binding domain-containing protein [Streptomyces sp. MAR4 CNX-425]|uniref:LysM peptidoglycan-binding domain-containing protein n=1 Tax=Streptomyces sp. MAR4 CNX-425 TaxID=3406343 RepID=UPI003B5079B3
MARSSASRTPVPVRIRRRTFGDVVRAFFAFLALVVLVVGVPGALAYFVGWPLPSETPSLSMLNEDVTTDVFVKVFAVVVWLAWAQFAACVLVEAKAAVSGMGMPGRVPGSGASQALARQLVAALLLLTAGAASFAPGLSQLGQQLDQNKPPPVAAAQQTPGQQVDTARPAVDVETPRGEAGGGEVRKDTREQAERDTKFYRIQPPEGRHHDSLWEIAERHLGDGRRYGEIYQLNKDRVQPDGSKLSQASLIRPGWIMEMPADAHGGDLVEMPDERNEVSKSEAEQIRDYDKSSPTLDERGGGGGGGDDRQATSGRGDRLVPDTPAVDRGSDDRTDVQQVPVREDGGAAERGAGDRAAPEVHSDGGGIGLPEVLIAAPLLAAGVLGALSRRRRQALWQAAFHTGGAGRTGAEPEGRAALARDALLVGADPGGVGFLDRALRGLSAALTESARPLPTIYAAWLTDSDLYLQLAGVAGEPPAPWRTGQDQTFWRIDRADVESYPQPEEGAAAAPYPGLASLGTREEARLLLNLEAVPGIAAVKGAPADRLAVLSSIAAELATNGWSDRMSVTVVGFGERLTELAPTRVRHLEDVPALLEVMEAESAQRANALGNAGHDSVLTGRAGQTGRTHWAPHLVLVATEPTAAEAERLAHLAGGSSRLGIGYLVGTGQEELAGASWEFEITRDGRLRAPLLGLELAAQRLPQEQHDALVELFSQVGFEGPATSGTDGRGISVTRAAGDVGFTVDLSEQGRPAVYARLLGSYEIMGLAEPDGERSPLLREALALLLIHREGVHPQVLAAALWPRGVTDDVRDAFIERLVGWLGRDPSGSARLAPDADGRLALSTSVVSDWDVLRTLHLEATDPDRQTSPQVRERLLNDALALAAGPLLADRPQGRYGWLSNEIVEAQLPLLVADAGLALAALRREAGQAEGAVGAVQSALVVAPADERLWNELLRAVHATGDTARLEATASDLLGRAAALHGARGLPPRTEALLDELLPGWRAQAGAAGAAG